MSTSHHTPGGQSLRQGTSIRGLDLKQMMSIMAFCLNRITGVPRLGEVIPLLLKSHSLIFALSFSEGQKGSFHRWTWDPFPQDHQHCLSTCSKSLSANALQFLHLRYYQMQIKLSFSTEIHSKDIHTCVSVSMQCARLRPPLIYTLSGRAERFTLGILGVKCHSTKRTLSLTRSKT